MGGYCYLSIGNLNFLTSKNSFGGLLMPFSPNDLSIKTTKDDDGETYTKRFFSLPVSKMIQILDSQGHTLNAAARDFSIEKSGDLEYAKYCTENDFLPSPTYGEISRKFTFKSWCLAVKTYAVRFSKSKHFIQDVLKKEQRKQLSFTRKRVIDSMLYNTGFWGISHENVDVWNVLRVVLDAFPETQTISLDYTDLYESGYCDEVPSAEDYQVAKTIILTEGKFDAEVLSEAITLLYPHMRKFYSFINFDEYRVQGSANFLTHYFKAFIASGIQNRVIALYDNDSAGLAEVTMLKGIACPDNYRVMHLPDIELAQSYPALGPNGLEYMDINGKAVSIELYLGRDILTEDAKLIPVQWKGLIEKTQTYQGEITKKVLVQQRYREKIKNFVSSNAESDLWKEMRLLLMSIFSAFNYGKVQRPLLS